VRGQRRARTPDRISVSKDKLRTTACLSSSSSLQAFPDQQLAIMSHTATATIHSGAISNTEGIFELHRPGSSTDNTPGHILRSSAESKRDFVPPREESADNGSPDDSELPTNAQTEVERWNYPRGNVGKIIFAFISCMVSGMNDAAVGVSSYSNRNWFMRLTFYIASLTICELIPDCLPKTTLTSCSWKTTTASERLSFRLFF
jgi:hypothetical protein